MEPRAVGLNNPRGSALLEALPVGLLLVFIVSGALLVAYFLFARSWIQYQSEQALYCAAQSHWDCKYQLQEKLQQFLPWGQTQVQVQGNNQLWTVEVQWKYRDYSFHLHKELNPAQILKTKVLQW
jgi:hypothetical protein